MANRGMTMQGLVAMAIGVLALLVVYTIIPLVGAELDKAVTLPGCTDTTNKTGCSTGYNWNHSVNTAVPTAYDTWESLGGILKVAAIIMIIGGFFRTFQGLRS